MISQVKVWKKAVHNSEFFDVDMRIYVDTDSGRDGCLYLSGNPWHKPGEITGKLTDADWEQARTLAFWDDKWHTLRPGEVYMRWMQIYAIGPQDQEEMARLRAMWGDDDATG